MTICSVTGCAKQVLAKDLCTTHYARKRRTGSIELTAESKPTVCIVNTCSREVVAKGLCRKHYIRNQKHGDPLHLERSPIYEGQVCLIEQCDKPTRSKGLCHNHYLNFNVHKKKGNYATIEEYISDKNEQCQ